MKPNPNPNDLQPIIPSGKQFRSVDELLHASGLPAEVKSAYDSAQRATAVCHRLSLMRTRAGISQAQMGKHLGLSQSAVSKLEAGTDETLTLGQIRVYCLATNGCIDISIGRPKTHVDTIKSHAFAMRSAMMNLAAIAHSDDQINHAIHAFFSEAFFNILKILADCSSHLPQASTPQINVADDPDHPLTQSRPTPRKRTLQST
jgi:transcriptional regulator with XRE-family HTH domain